MDNSLASISTVLRTTAAEVDKHRNLVESLEEQLQLAEMHLAHLTQELEETKTRCYTLETELTADKVGGNDD